MTDPPTTKPNSKPPPSVPMSFDVYMPESLDRRPACRAWFTARGATCHDTTAGLVVVIDPTIATRIFGTRPTPGADIPTPDDLNKLVGGNVTITFAPPPELFI